MKIAPSSPSSPSHHQWLRCWNSKKEKQEAKSGKGKEKKRCNYNQCATEDHWLGSGL
jgi:ribosome modulation factor